MIGGDDSRIKKVQVDGDLHAAFGGTCLSGIREWFNNIGNNI